MAADLVRFIHISDTHIGPTPEYAFNGAKPYSSVKRLVGAINQLPFEPDFVLHTGDVVTDPDPAAYRLAAQIFSHLKFPIYYVSGNHDFSKTLKENLSMGAKDDLSVEEGLNCYGFTLLGQRFLVLDAQGDPEIEAHGQLNELQYQILERELGKNIPLSIAIHFPALKLDTRWVDRDMLLLDGEKFHSFVQRAGNLRGVFTGHSHRMGVQLQDGVLYVSVASPVGQFSMWPQDQYAAVEKDSDPRLVFNLVTLTQDATIIKEFPVAGE